MAKKKTETLNESTVIAELAVKGMQEKKAKDVVILDMQHIGSSLFDAFVVCHGNSPAQVEAIADSVEMEIKKATGMNPWRREGYTNCEWIVLDYVNVIVHIFLNENRTYYRLESLWGDAPQTKFENIE